MSEIITLLISWHLAMKLGKDESEAIFYTANQLNKNIEREDIKKIINTLALESTSKESRIRILRALKNALPNQPK